jgi:hypothetical protein
VIVEPVRASMIVSVTRRFCRPSRAETHCVGLSTQIPKEPENAARKGFKTKGAKKPFMIFDEPQCKPLRHCEGRSPVAIHTAFPLASAFRMADPPHGLPRRAARAMTESPPLWIAPRQRLPLVSR